MIDYNQYINALRKCAKEHENDITSFAHIRVSDLCKDTANLLEELEKEEKWIPVNERLPKIAGVYIVTRCYPNNIKNPDYRVDACFFDGSGTWYNDNRINHERVYVDNIIAWQENPEPYKIDLLNEFRYKNSEKKNEEDGIHTIDTGNN
jgi:hypothetical protein